MLQLSFFLLFLEIGHDNHSYLVFLHFLVKLSDISFSEYMHRTLTCESSAPLYINYMYHPYYIFLISFHEKHQNYLFWTFTLDPENILYQYWPPFLFFELFYSHFSSRNANVSIFGNVHWTLNPPTLSPMIPYFFFPFYSYFSLSIAILSIFGNAHWTLNPPTSSPMILYFVLFFSYFIAIFHLA